MKISRRELLVGGAAVTLTGLTWRVAPAEAESSGAPLAVPPVRVLVRTPEPGAVELLWMAVPGTSSYRVARDGAVLADQQPTRYLDRDGGASSTRHYTVAALDDVGGTLASTQLSVTVAPAGDPVAPGAPQSLTARVSGSTVDLRWRAPSDGGGIVGYRVKFGPRATPVEQLAQLPTTDGQTSCRISGLLAGSDFLFSVQAVAASGRLSSPTVVAARTDPANGGSVPAAPSSSSVVAKPFSATRVDLVWAASTSSVAAYEVLRDGAVIGTVPAQLRRTFSDNGVMPSSTHSYQVQSVGVTGSRSAPTTARRVMTPAPGATTIPRGPYVQWASSEAVVVAWWTNTEVPSLLRYGTPSFMSEVRDAHAGRRHAMVLAGLEPGTRYDYEVVAGTASAGGSFMTAPPRGRPSSFAVVGDFGGGSAQMQQIATAIAAGGTDFVQTVGDNVYPDSQDPDFATVYSDFDARFYKPYREVLRCQTFWAAAGNKEYYGDGAFWQNFWLPDNGRWYSYDWGDAHLLVLASEDPYEPGTPQHDFAVADLTAARDAPWRIVVIHRPPYSSTTANSSAESIRTHLVPMFEELGVALVLSGNSHNYERTHPLRQGTPDPHGIVYVVTGGGGNGLNAFKLAQPAWSALRAASYEFLRIDVRDDRLDLTAFTEKKAVLDATSIGRR